MLVRVLGAAAGGGFPQWNCGCTNCRRLRLGTLRGSARSQAQLALSADAENWFLVNASPDLRSQIESFPALHPRPDLFRDSPIQGVVLTSAELDASLGLLLLRESQPLLAYATQTVRSLLDGDNAMFGVLRRQPDQVAWRRLQPGAPMEMETLSGGPAGIRCTPVSAGGGFPGHVSRERSRELDASEAVIGLFFEQGGRRLAFFPGLPAVDPAWLGPLEQCDAILVDGAFWSDDKLIRIQGAGKTAREMGHLPVGGEDGSIRALSSLRRPRKIFIHINNSNPILDEDSEEHRVMRNAGWEIAADGMELCL